MTPEEFFMTSSEIEFLRPVRRAKVIERRKYGSGKDWLLVEIDPSLIGQRFGLGGKDVTRLLITPRHKGDSLFPISSWPVYVHVALPPELSEPGEDAQPDSFGWAEIHPSRDKAEAESEKAGKR